MKITSTLNIKNQSFSGIKKHVQHDKNLNHSNANIDYSKSFLNDHDVILNEQDLQNLKEERYQKQFEKYNAAQKKSRHTSNMFDSVDEFVKSKEKKFSFDKSAVATFGNKENQDNLLSGKTDTEKEAILKKQSIGLAEYAKSFNQRNKYLKVGQYTTNVDEFTPHVHMQLIPLGKTAKGKPSMSLNTALKAEYQYQTGNSIKDTRKALSWFRENEDNALVDHVSRSLGLNYDLNRTHEHVEDFDSYKKIKVKLEEKNRLANEQAQMIKKQQTLMINSKTKVIDFIQDKEPTHKVTANKKITEPKEVITQDGYNQHLHTPASNLFGYAWEVIKKETKRQFGRLKKWEHDLKERALKLTQRENSVAEREKNINKIQKRLKLKENSLNEYKDKLTAKEINNGNFDRAKEVQSIEPDSWEDLSKLAEKKLNNAAEITSEENRKKREREKEQQRNKQLERQRQQRAIRLKNQRGGMSR